MDAGIIAQLRWPRVTPERPSRGAMAERISKLGIVERNLVLAYGNTLINMIRAQAEERAAIAESGAEVQEN